MAEALLTDLTEGLRKSRDDAERAIALDPNLASAYLALADTQISCDWNWDAANTSVTKAAALEPGSVDPLQSSSYHDNLIFHELLKDAVTGIQRPLGALCVTG
jgi:hypothetical protein